MGIAREHNAYMNDYETIFAKTRSNTLIIYTAWVKEYHWSIFQDGAIKLYRWKEEYSSDKITSRKQFHKCFSLLWRCSRDSFTEWLAELYVHYSHFHQPQKFSCCDSRVLLDDASWTSCTAASNNKIRWCCGCQPCVCEASSGMPPSYTFAFRNFGDHSGTNILHFSYTQNG